MKRFLVSISVLLVGAGSVMGYLFFTGWFHDPQTALRALKKQMVAPTPEQAFAAVERGDVQMLTLLSRAGVSMKGTDADGNTLLHLAIRNERWITANELVESEINLDARNEASEPPLQAVLELANLRLAKRMLEHGADPNSIYDSGQPALIEAIVSKETSTVQLLLEHKADPNITNVSGANPLYLAIRSGQLLLIPDLLRAGARAGTTTPAGQPVLNFLCEHYHSCGYTEDTALALLRQLLSAGADPEATDPNGKHPLRHALEQGFQAGAKELLPLVQKVEDTLWIPLSKGDMSIAKALIEKGADVNQIRGDGETPLCFAIRSANAEMVTYSWITAPTPCSQRKRAKRLSHWRSCYKTRRRF